MPRPLFPQGNRPLYPFDRLGGLQNRSGRCEEEKNMLLLPGIEPRLSSPQHGDITTELPLMMCIFRVILEELDEMNSSKKVLETTRMDTSFCGPDEITYVLSPSHVYVVWTL
jgi:hypothetical protein